MVDQFSGLDPKEANRMKSSLKKADLVDVLANLIAERRTNNTLDSFVKKRNAEPAEPSLEQAAEAQAPQKQQCVEPVASS